MLKVLLIICGPTCSGKTEAALTLLRKIRGEIISADSRQVYRGMDIGTAKVSAKIRREFPHHLVDIVNPDQVFSAAEFAKRTSSIIDTLQKKDFLPIMVGGSGLYIKAVIDGLFSGPAADPELRESLRKQAQREGKETLYLRLKKVDPQAAQVIHPHDLVRICRALEVYQITGKPISFFQRQSARPLCNTVMIGLRLPRHQLYRNIDSRVDKMVEQGLISEVKALFHQGYREDLPAMQGVGYRQAINYLEGKYSLEETIRLIKRDTRRLAKRQLNWFNQDERIIWLNRDEFSSAEELAEEIVRISLKKLPQLSGVLR